jgi:hypothetical protein
VIQLRLRRQLLTWQFVRSPWLPCAGAWFLTTALATLWLPAAWQRSAQQAHALAAQEADRAMLARAARQQAAPTPAMQAFWHALMTREAAYAAIAEVLSRAAAHGLSVGPVDYPPEVGTGGFSSIQVVLPVKGGYEALRELLVDTLLRFPMAALGDLTVSRDGVDSTELSTTLRFTFYVRPTDTSTAKAPR